MILIVERDGFLQAVGLLCITTTLGCFVVLYLLLDLKQGTGLVSTECYV